MFIVPLGVIWLGYQLTWYGFAMLKGPGMGFTDLMLPSRISKADSVIKGWGSSAPSFAAPTTPNTSVQPGSSYYPPNPQGGLPSKPPLGNTPPAYYG